MKYKITYRHLVKKADGTPSNIFASKDEYYCFTNLSFKDIERELVKKFKNKNICPQIEKIEDILLTQDDFFEEGYQFIMTN